MSADPGPGIAPHDLGRIFALSFTSKHLAEWRG